MNDYLYKGFRDPPQKITGDSYRALYGIPGGYRGFVRKKIGTKYRIAIDTLLTVYHGIQRHIEIHGEAPLTYSALCKDVSLGRSTVANCVQKLKKRGIIETVVYNKDNHKGLIYYLKEDSWTGKD